MSENSFKKISEGVIENQGINSDNDKLIQVRFKDGSEKWIKKQKLAKRYVYNKDEQL